MPIAWVIIDMPEDLRDGVLVARMAGREMRALALRRRTANVFAVPTASPVGNVCNCGKNAFRFNESG
jgi:predicted RNase H-like nuclease